MATAAAANVKPAILELGGKSAAIIMPDADLDAVMDSVRWGIYFNAGQVCSAMSRMIAHEDIHDEIVDRCVELAEGLSVGPGIERREFGANMGAMVPTRSATGPKGLSRRRRGRHHRHRRAAAEPSGIFLAPTVISGVTPDMQIATGFGPVLSC